MNENDAAKIVMETISELFSVPLSEISKSTTAMDIDGWDSLSHTDLILLLEEKIDKNLPLDKIQECENVGDLVDVVGLTVGA